MSRFQVRRATAEDLPQLQLLWQMENLPVESLEARVGEFEVAVSDGGEIVAALGLELADGQGRLHSETIGWADLEDQLRGQLWLRLEMTARQQGLIRLWTNLEAPFWKSVGFKKSSQEALASLPASFAGGEAAWLHLPLRAADAGADELAKQFAVLKAMSQAENERLIERARIMKWVAIGLITIVFGAFAVWVVYFVRLRSRVRSRRGRD